MSYAEDDDLEKRREQYYAQTPFPEDLIRFDGYMDITEEGFVVLQDKYSRLIMVMAYLLLREHGSKGDFAMYNAIDQNRLSQDGFKELRMAVERAKLLMA